MNLNRDNYEEFFLLYVDNELTLAERKLVEAFVLGNTDLGEELDMLQASKLQPETSLFYEDKKNLLKQTEEISVEAAAKAEELFLLYIDGELDEAGKKTVENLASSNSSLQRTLLILQQSRLQADPALGFEGKEILLRKETVRMGPWFRMSAAAVLLFVAGYFFFGHRRIQKNLGTASSGNPVKAARESEVIKNQSSVTPAPVDSLYQIRGTAVVTKIENKIPSPQKHEKKDQLTGSKSRKKGNRMNNYVMRNPSLGEDNKDNRLRHPVLLPSRETDLSNNVKNNTALELTNPIPVRLVAKNADPGGQEPRVVISENSAAEDISLASESGKKNRIRGLIRKISRVLDKNTHLNSDSKKRGLRIGNYQIAFR